MDFALDYLARYLSDYTYLGLFLILSVGAFGFPIPEEIVLMAAGLFVYQGATTLGTTLAVCAAGQVIGDLLLFAVGWRYGTGALHGIIRRLVAPERVSRIQEQLDRYGLLVVFFGRYLTGVRPAVFLAAGAARIPVRKFIVVDGLSAVISLFVWVLIGWAASGWIELVLAAVGQAEEQILAALVAIVLVVILEKVLLRFGLLSPGSSAARVTSWIRIPVLTVIIVFSVLLAREHHLAKRSRLLAGAGAETPRLVEDMGLLIEILPDLAPPGRPYEVVFVGDSALLTEALLQAGYRPAAPPASEGSPDHAPELFVAAPGAAPGMAFWRSNYVYRAETVWLGRFTGPVSIRDLRDLSRVLTRHHYALRTAVGPKVHPHDKRRVLIAVLRHPHIREAPGEAARDTPGGAPGE